MKYKVLLVTPGQPALDPRVVKEADALSDAGYEVTVVYAYWNEWGEKYSRELFPKKKWKAIRVGGHPKAEPLTYFISRLRHKLFKWCFSKFGLFADVAITRSARSLIKAAQRKSADLYIGHNLGALPAVVKAAKKHNAKCGFDIEDLHRFEVSDDTGSFNYRLVKRVEDSYIEQLNYLTASSPQIANEYRQFYPSTDPVTVLNVFPKCDAVKERKTSPGPVRLFWFSQTIGRNRGIEDVVIAMNQLKAGAFELHLLGNINDDTKSYFKNISDDPGSIYFYGPMPPDDVFEFASKFDIGLATENNYPLNRDLCLTNKIFTYLQAGLAVIASGTTAQKSFIEKYKEIGAVYPVGDIVSMVNILSAWEKDRPLLNTIREASYLLGREEMNWENEQLKFLSLVNKTLSN